MYVVSHRHLYYIYIFSFYVPHRAHIGSCYYIFLPMKRQELRRKKLCRMFSQNTVHNRFVLVLHLDGPRTVINCNKPDTFGLFWNPPNNELKQILYKHFKNIDIQVCPS